jgi:hypothetical protein
MRTGFSLAALALALTAVVVSYLDTDTVELAFFVLVTTAAATQAWLVRDTSLDWRRWAAMGIAIGWVLAAVGIGVLLMTFQAASRGPSSPEETYLGLTATVYHLAAVYGGALLVVIAAFGPKRWLEHSRR